jgi:hypothetical protein
MASCLIPFQRDRFTIAHLMATVTANTLCVIYHRFIIDNRNRLYGATLNAFKARYTNIFMDNRAKRVLEGQRNNLCKWTVRVSEVARTCIGGRPLIVLNKQALQTVTDNGNVAQVFHQVSPLDRCSDGRRINGVDGN